MGLGTPSEFPKTNQPRLQQYTLLTGRGVQYHQLPGAFWSGRASKKRVGGDCWKTGSFTYFGQKKGTHYNLSIDIYLGEDIWMWFMQTIVLVFRCEALASVKCFMCDSFGFFCFFFPSIFKMEPGAFGAGYSAIGNMFHFLFFFWIFFTIVFGHIWCLCPRALYVIQGKSSTFFIQISWTKRNIYIYTCASPK